MGTLLEGGGGGGVEVRCKGWGISEAKYLGEGKVAWSTNWKVVGRLVNFEPAICNGHLPYP